MTQINIDEYIKNNNILIYNKKCPYSLNVIQKINSLNLEFDGIEILSKNKIPKIVKDIENYFGVQIKYVPTIIVDSGEYMLSGDDIYEWFDLVESTNNNTQINNNTNSNNNLFKTIDSLNNNFVNYNQTNNNSMTMAENFQNMNVSDSKFENIKDKGQLSKSFEEMLKERNLSENLVKKPKNINFETGEVIY